MLIGDHLQNSPVVQNPALSEYLAQTSSNHYCSASSVLVYQVSHWTNKDDAGHPLHSFLAGDT